MKRTNNLFPLVLLPNNMILFVLSIIFNLYTCHKAKALAYHTGNGELTLFDFRTCTDLDGWEEASDSTFREVGLSKAVLSLQKTRVFQRAVFFALLNPQPNGAAFAGVRTERGRFRVNLTDFESIVLRVRPSGNPTHYKITLRHNLDETEGAYEQIFQVSSSASNEFRKISLPLSQFKFYKRGKIIPDYEPLNKAHISGVSDNHFYGKQTMHRLIIRLLDWIADIRWGLFVIQTNRSFFPRVGLP